MLATPLPTEYIVFERVGKDKSLTPATVGEVNEPLSEIVKSVERKVRVAAEKLLKGEGRTIVAITVYQV